MRRFGGNTPYAASARLSAATDDDARLAVVDNWGPTLTHIDLERAVVDIERLAAAAASLSFRTQHIPCIYAFDTSQDAFRSRQRVREYTRAVAIVATIG